MDQFGTKNFLLFLILTTTTLCYAGIIKREINENNNIDSIVDFNKTETSTERFRKLNIAENIQKRGKLRFGQYQSTTSATIDEINKKLEESTTIRKYNVKRRREDTTTERSSTEEGTTAKRFTIKRRPSVDTLFASTTTIPRRSPVTTTTTTTTTTTPEIPTTEKQFDEINEQSTTIESDFDEIQTTTEVFRFDLSRYMNSNDSSHPDSTTTQPASTILDFEKVFNNHVLTTPENYYSEEKNQELQEKEENEKREHENKLNFNLLKFKITTTAQTPTEQQKTNSNDEKNSTILYNNVEIESSNYDVAANEIKNNSGSIEKKAKYLQSLPNKVETLTENSLSKNDANLTLPDGAEVWALASLKNVEHINTRHGQLVNITVEKNAKDNDTSVTKQLTDWSEIMKNNEFNADSFINNDQIKPINDKLELVENISDLSDSSVVENKVVPVIITSPNLDDRQKYYHEELDQTTTTGTVDTTTNIPSTTSIKTTTSNQQEETSTEQETSTSSEQDFSTEQIFSTEQQQETSTEQEFSTEQQETSTEVDLPTTFISSTTEFDLSNIELSESSTEVLSSTDNNFIINNDLSTTTSTTTTTTTIPSTVETTSTKIYTTTDDDDEQDEDEDYDVIKSSTTFLPSTLTPSTTTTEKFNIFYIESTTDIFHQPEISTIKIPTTVSTIPNLNELFPDETKYIVPKQSDRIETIPTTTSTTQSSIIVPEPEPEPVLKPIIRTTTEHLIERQPQFDDETTTDETSTDDHLISEPNTDEPDVNAIIAISVSVVGVIALGLLIGFLYVMRKRQRQSFKQRCRPVGLDAYSLDNVSVYNSVRRQGKNLRLSKRTYGNSAFEDPDIKSNVLNIPGLASFVQNKNGIFDEFKEIPQVTARVDEVPAGCESKNRYANVVPLPETRVHLKQQNDDEKSEYINANYVKGPKDSSNYYIATQAPLEHTNADFWRMLWEQNSKVVVMATDLMENGIEKCSDYLPPSVVLDCHRTFGDFQVTLKNREVKEKYAVSMVILKNMTTDTWKEITHFWYQWPESGVPADEASIIAMLLEARSYLKMSAIEQTGEDSIKEISLVDKTKSLQRIQGPLTVHCSPGTGRTGTIIACDIAIRALEMPTRSVDIPKIVYYVRRGRASTVKTREQYEFVYKISQMYATKLTGPVTEN